MKTNKIIPAFAFVIGLVFALSFISAAVSITFPAYNATLNADTSITYYNSTGNIQRISDFDALAYRCTTGSCASFASGSDIQASTSGNSITVTFPTLTHNATYGIYFYKNEYIGWEQIITNIPAGLTGSFSGPQIFFAKKEAGFAPIMNLSVQEEIPTGRPIRIGFNVSIDADTYSAIANSGPLNINPAQLDNYKQVQTLVTLEIRNSTNALVYNASQIVNIPYSSSLPVSFDYSGFSNTGAYTVNVFTDVIDKKILNSRRLNATAEISVIPRNLTNYTFTLIQNLNMAPALPVQGDNVGFSFNYASGFVNETDSLLPANTTLNMTIYRESSQIWNSVVNTGSNGTYSFSRVFSDIGNYRVLVAGSPNDSRGNRTIPSSQEITFIISSNSTTPPEEDDDHDTHHHHRDASDKEEIPLESLPLSLSGNSTINLSTEPGISKSKHFYGFWIWMLIIAVLVLLILVVITFIVKYS